MNNITSMHVLECSCKLVHQIHFLFVVAKTGPDCRMQVGLSKVEHQIDVSVVLADADCMKTYNVRVFFHFIHDLNLSQCPKRIDFVDEGIVYFLDSDTLTIQLVNRFPNCAVITLTHLLDHFVLCLDIFIYSVPFVQVAMRCFLKSFFLL